jgi:hypothetical protein
MYDLQRDNENDMSNRRRLCLAVLLATIGSAAWAAQPSFRILYHEQIALRKSGASGARERVTFDAYGRRFELLLEPNVRMKRAMRAADAGIEPMQGTVAGTSGSWVRLTRGPSGWRGVFSDGQDIYAIEPAADVADATTQPLDPASSEPVVYRLHDALLPLGDEFCETPLAPVPDEAPTALSAFKSLSSELRIQAAANPNRQIRVGVVADYEFAQSFGFEMTPEEAVIARVNIVDGIFSSQAGVKIELGESTIFRNENDPFTRAGAGNLLEEVRRYRRDTPSQLSLGLTHLMTGRNLSGDTVGIAYLGSVCGGGSASSLSEGVRSTISSALIAAHEIGHNFNAPHDGDNGGACATTPQTFLMAPRLNGSDQFSACSLTQIQPIVNSGSCLTAFTPADVSLIVPNGSVSTTVDTPVSISFNVNAIGDEASDDVVADATLPSGVTVQSATATGTTCTTGAGTVSCSFGQLVPGESRTVTLGLIAPAAGTFTANVSVASSNDSIDSNNASGVTLTVANVAPVIPPTQGSTGGASTGGGGGGRIDLSFLMLLGAAAGLVRFRRYRKVTRC